MCVCARACVQKSRQGKVPPAPPPPGAQPTCGLPASSVTVRCSLAVMARRGSMRGSWKVSARLAYSGAGMAAS